MGLAADLARRLAQNAEAVCREYLSNGRREGGTWRIGDVDNTPGRSLIVRLTGPDSGKGAAGRWVDFGSGQYGDLLDLIAHTCRLHTFRDVLEEARRFLSVPQQHHAATPGRSPVPSGSPEAARRLFASAKPITGTLAAIYLRSRGITDVHDLTALRFHPTCFYRAHEGAPRETWPALLAAVTDADGVITGVLRTWLARNGLGKAPLSNFVTIAVLLLGWLIVLLAFFVLSVQLFITIIEFKLTVLAGFVLVPFALFGQTAFLAERVLGNVISSGIKLMVLAIVVGIGASIFGTLVRPTGEITLTQAASTILAAIAVFGLALFIPDLAAGLVSGAPQLGAGSAVATTAALGGSAIAGGLLASGARA
jgi:hypothetical protein